MANKEQLESVVLEMAAKFEQMSENFGIAIRHVNSRQEPRWFTPKKMLLNFIRITALASPVEIQVLACAIHGAIDVLGISGSLKLILEMRRKHAARQQGQK